MLEIVLLFFLCKKIGETLREKGRNPLGYQALLVVTWFGSEFMAGVVWAVVTEIRNPGSEVQFGIGLYLAALSAAAVGAACVFLIAHLMPPAN